MIPSLRDVTPTGELFLSLHGPYSQPYRFLFPPSGIMLCNLWYAGCSQILALPDDFTSLSTSMTLLSAYIHGLCTNANSASFNFDNFDKNVTISSTCTSVARTSSTLGIVGEFRRIRSSYNRLPRSYNVQWQLQTYSKNYIPNEISVFIPVYASSCSSLIRPS